MPSPETILAGLAAIANDWRWLAMAWHVWVAVLLGLLVGGWRPSVRTAWRLLIAPLISVAVLAWRSGNPFNGATLAANAQETVPNEVETVVENTWTPKLGETVWLAKLNAEGTVTELEQNSATIQVGTLRVRANVPLT